jgi:hypothetical protein
MDSTYINQRQMIERYVRGTLTDEELEAFEIYLLDHPETVEDVEYEKGLQHALAGAHELLQPAAAGTGLRSGAAWLGPRYAMAATVLLGVVAVLGVSQWRLNARLNDEIELLRAPTVLSEEIRLESLRGAAPVIVEKRSDEPLLLSVAAEAPGPYTLHLRSADAAFSWDRSNVEPGVDGTLRISAPNLGFGRYELGVVPADASRASDYVFELRPAR